jgi:hypothetical protein
MVFQSNDLFILMIFLSYGSKKTLESYISETGVTV